MIQSAPAVTNVEVHLAWYLRAFYFQVIAPPQLSPLLRLTNAVAQPLANASPNKDVRYNSVASIACFNFDPLHAHFHDEHRYLP